MSNGTRSTTDNSTTPASSAQTALEALQRGYQPIPIRDNAKMPHGSAWTHARHDEDTVVTAFETYASEGASNLGLLLGEPSGNLVDIDLDHPKATRLRDFFLPPTAMKTGRIGRPKSHYWYRATGTLPGTRRYKIPNQTAAGTVSVELRANGTQTVIPPSRHPSGEDYRWEGTPWGGDIGPAEVDGRTLSVQVALMGLCCILLDGWPTRGERHDAYLALVGGLLRFGDEVHPYWERNVSPLVRAIALATHDDDGPDQREAESIRTTIDGLRSGKKITGFNRLSEIIGEKHVDHVRRMAQEVESLAGFNATAGQSDVPEGRPAPNTGLAGRSLAEALGTSGEAPEGLAEEPGEGEIKARDPLAERVATWQPVDLGPYLEGKIEPPKPSVLKRDDGAALFYPGRVNSLYGRSESAKSWVALIACLQEMGAGERVMYIDFEDDPIGSISRLIALGAGHDDIRHQFAYIRPEEGHSRMQIGRYGKHEPSDIGSLNEKLLNDALASIDPSLIICDGMTVMYGLHGLDTNDQSSTDIVINFLKWLTRNGRSTVVVIDHVAKGGGKGSKPIGSQHKIAMVQGTALQVVPIAQPQPGVVGHMELVVGKDRPGEVRKVSTKAEFQVAADVYLDSTVEGITKFRIEAPTPGVIVGESEEGNEILTKLGQAQKYVLKAFAGDLDLVLTMAKIRVRMEYEFTAGTLRNAVAGLVSDGTLEKEGDTRGSQYRLAPPEPDGDPGSLSGPTATERRQSWDEWVSADEVADASDDA